MKEISCKFAKKVQR